MSTGPPAATMELAQELAAATPTAKPQETTPAIK